MLVKICGITRLEDALAAARFGADFVGLVLADSPRRVTVGDACRIVGRVPAPTQPVLVFRDAALDEVLAAMDATQARWVQLHGHETVEYIGDLAARRPNVAIIKAWQVSDRASVDDLRDYVQTAQRQNARIDKVLLDAPKGGSHPGADTFAAVSRGWDGTWPELWCAGGLTPPTLAAAVAGARYSGVDVASGVESAPRVKDHQAMRAFIELAHSL